MLRVPALSACAAAREKEDFMRIVDLTTLLEGELPSDPDIQIPHIQNIDHKATAPGMKDFFPGTTEADLPEGNGWAIDFVQMCTHSGTHIDAA